jgi:uncharacterized protein (TIGR03435 family)
MQSILQEVRTDTTWKQIAPLLEEAMLRLGQTDRDALVLRYFEGRSFNEVGTALGASEAAAKKSVNRALEKLHRYFSIHGVSSTTAIIAGELSINSVQAAPAAIAETVTALAIAKGATATASTLTIMKGVLKIMAWTKVKTAVVIGFGVLIALGTTTATVNEIQKYWAYRWQVLPFNRRVLDQAPPLVKIVSSKLRPYGGLHISGNKMLGLSLPAFEVLVDAYNFSLYRRVILTTDLPPDTFYDFIASLPSGNNEALQQEIKRRFGIVAKREMIETNVLLLKVRYQNSLGLKPSTTLGSRQSIAQDEYTCVNLPVSYLADYLETIIGTPVLDQTSLTGNFDIDLKWDVQRGEKGEQLPGPLKQALIDELGLELVPGNEPIEMLVVEKAD